MTLVPGDTNLEDLPFTIHRSLCLRLENNGGWLTVANYLIEKGVDLDIEFLAAQQCSSERLLSELAIRICDVDTLCNILDDCELHHALAVLKNPEPVNIITQPGQGKECMQVALGGNLELYCEARSLPPPLYQWFRDNVQLTDANSNHLTITDFGPELEGRYFCKVRADIQGAQEICSNEVDVSVAPILPDIVEQPEGVNRQEGETVCLKCIVDAYPKPSYQWYRGNQLLDGRTKNTLYINYAKASDSGVYRCVVSNKAGEVSSEAVRVQVVHADIPLLKAAERCIAKEKLALLIGNVKYDNHECLAKPVDDVVLLSTKLTAIGFKVITLVNLRLVEMRNALQQFSHQLIPGVYGLFYFAGHGIQADERLMLPVDAPKSYGPEHCLTEREVKNLMLLKCPMLRVIILDMCLKSPGSPIPQNSQKAKALPPDDIEGKPDINLILAYSTSGNLSAYERRSEPNGTYVKYLSQFIKEEISIMGVFQKTHEAIYNETIKMKEVTQQQIPMLMSNVYKKFSFTDAVSDKQERDMNLPYLDVAIKNSTFFNTTVLKHMIYFPTWAPVVLTVGNKIWGMHISGDSDIDRFFSAVYVPPMSEELDFNPSINIEPRPKALYFRHRECILNVIDIQIHGIDLEAWRIKVCSQKEILNMEGVPITEWKEKDVFHITVEELQGPAVAGNLNFTINLKDQQGCLIASTPLFLLEPLVAKWFLWVEPEDP